MIANIGGIVPLSTVDWHGRSSVVVFFNGCPFHCGYCHNYDLLTQSNPIDLESVKKKIAESKPYVSAVVFLGGEPLLQCGAAVEISRFAQENNLLVGIHTNGYYPKAVQYLIENKLADKFFVDIKAPFNESAYQKTIAFSSDKTISNIQETIRIIDKSPLDLEIKTTVFPKSVGSETDIASIADWIHANVFEKQKLTYVLQQGKGKNSNDPVFQEMSFLSPAEMKRLADIALDRLKDAVVITQTDEEGRVVISKE